MRSCARLFFGQTPTQFSSVVVARCGQLRPTLGTVLRIAVDAGSIWAALLFGGLLIEGGDFSALILRLITPQFPHIVPLVGLFSILTLVTYTGAGLYTCIHRCTLSAKIYRIVGINLVLFAIAGLVLSFTQLATPSTALVLVTGFMGSTFLLCIARVVSVILRSEDGSGVNVRVDEGPDERKVLVIGGAGYVGSALIEKLLRLNLHVVVIDTMHFGKEPLSRVADHPNLTLIKEDFRNLEALTRAMSGVGSVIHLAGLVGDPACAVDPALTVDINVTATKLVGEIAKARGVRRFIFASSCSVYGASDEIVDELARLNPQSLYARSKVAAEAVLDGLNSDDFAVTCLRFSTIYGISGRTRFDLVVNLLCARAVRDGIITVFGADQWRPFVHVDDVATSILMTLQAPIDFVAGEVFNVGSDALNYTLGDVAEHIRYQVPEARIVSDASCCDRRNYRVSFEKIRTRLNFEPVWTLDRGIAQVLALVRSNEVGDYALPTYSNVLFLKECGTKSFETFKITGWENDLMNIDHIHSSRPMLHSAA
jgi:nucleoside-diphosphate-sugar epimerase